MYDKNSKDSLLLLNQYMVNYLIQFVMKMMVFPMYEVKMLYNLNRGMLVVYVLLILHVNSHNYMTDVMLLMLLLKRKMLLLLRLLKFMIVKVKQIY